MPEPPRTGDAVLDLVRKSDAVDPAALSAYLARTAEPGRAAGAATPLPDALTAPAGPTTPPPSPTDTATDLVRAGLLTPFQARLILQGRYRGFRIGPYRVLDQLGAGGMGQVFLAEHTAMRRRVAVKVLPGQLAADRAGVERFYREARAAAALDHPNIVRAHDVGCDKGTHFLVMEYVEGVPLDRRLREAGGRLRWGEACGYVVQAAAGLKHAHDKGVVHRDIKPSNLLIDRDGVVKILDMGLARFFADESDKLTKQLDGGAVMGTADYVSPEQLLASDSTDHRSDVYSLGAALYHLVTGRAPFEGTTTAKLLAHQLRDAPPAHTVVPDVPEELSAVVTKMMAKKPADRFPDMGEVVGALLPFVNDPRSGPASSAKFPPMAQAAVNQSTANLQSAITRANEPTPALPGEVADEQAARRKKRYAIAGLAAVVLAGAAAIAVAVANMPDKGKPAAGGDTAAGGRESPGSPSPSPSGGLTSPGSPPAGPARLTLAFKPAVDAKASTESTVFTPDGKYLLTSGGDKLVRVWDAASGKAVRRLEAHSGNVRALSLLPDGKRVLSASADKTIRLWNFQTGELLRTYDLVAPATNVAALPNGRRFLSAAHDGTVWLWDLDTGEAIRKYAPEKLPVYGLAVTRDGRRAVAATWDSKRNDAKADAAKLAPVAVWVLDLETGAEVGRQTAPASVSHVGLSPDSRRVVFGTADGVAVWEPDARRFRAYSGLNARVTSAAFTRDGRHVVATGHDRNLSLWDAETGKLLATEPALPAQGYAVGAAPDGKRVAVGGATGGVAVWQLPAGAVARTPDARNPRLAEILTGHTAALEDVLYTPDGARVVACGADRTVRVWLAATGEQIRAFPVPHPSARGLALLGSDRLVVTFAQDPDVRLYDLNTGAELRTFAHGKGVASVAALADGKRFLTCGADQEVRLWDADGGKEPDRFPLGSDGRGLAVTPDGSTVVVGCADKTVRVWDVAKREEVRRTAVAAVAWRIGVSADGAWAGFGNGPKLQLWNLATGESRVLDGPKTQVDGVAFTRDGRFVLAASADRGLYVWDTTTGALLGKATEHAAAVRGLALAPDGRHAVTSSVDGTAMVWTLPDAIVPK